MRKISCLLLIVLSLGLATSVVGAQNIELTYWTHTDDNRTIIENRYIEEFQELYPNVTIKRVVNEAAKMG
ncbi:MAG TPA: ABC transporter substrate-binding protein, partial [Firmicutes bacterium]|nr:ABC transporter substrate-binding protein [Bacillota bacterium]